MPWLALSLPMADSPAQILPTARDAEGDRKVAVAMLTNLFHPVATGSSTQVQGLARALAARGHRVIVITPRLDANSPEHERVDGFDVYRIPTVRLPRMSISLNFPWLNWTLWPANLRRIAALLESHGIELLHVHNHMFDLALSAMILKRRLGLPVVLTLHTIIRHSIEAFNLVLYPADRRFLRHTVVRHADAVICPDMNMSAYLDEAFGRSDGELIPYGISLPEHPGAETEQALIARLGMRGRRVILSLGHLHALRNRLDLIRAMPAVRARVPEVLLLIVGSVGDQRAIELCRELDLGEHVLFTGAQPHEYVGAFHALAELEAMWLDQADGGKNSLGIACMEAMLAGKPVLTVSNVDTFGPGVLESGGNVVILQAGRPDLIADAINALLADPASSARIGAAARDTALRLFAWPRIAARTAECYRATLNRAVVSVESAPNPARPS